jgi:hypothetical protein
VCVQNMLQNLADAGPSNAFAFVPDAFEEAHRSISYGKPGISKAIIDKQESIVYVHNLNPG